ncbi:MAG: outer membrane protein assembly factor BamA [Novosphingobium sp.]|uniref:outer membrane protein assembly factor BamA n=1 Tax=Novosphingobium sp. TaxID=1874826 RepID=UPI00391BD367|nr:outer membrane protein assembly factor BamA [Novosphingobium sp.]
MPKNRIASNRQSSLRIAAALLGTTILGGLPQAALAQDATAAPAAPTPAPEAPAAIQSIAVVGSQRLEPDTIRSYIKLRIGQPYTQQAADQALKDLFATELFSDVQIRNDGGNVTITVKENPVINRIILEGNKRLKEDKILPEIKLAPRQIFTRSKVRADVARIIELYKRQGRFAASVEPKMVLLDQNRVDIVFEIQEGPKSKVRKINIIGNEMFDDGDLKDEMVTKETGLTKIFSSGTSYDPDRMAFDQQKLRQFYLTKGYADFRIVSAVAELTPDKKDFILTYVVEEGQRYKFGDVKVDSQLRDFDSDRLATQLPMKKGDWYDAKMVEDTIEKLNETAGAFGYAFADVRPNYDRNKDDLSMGITFQIAEAPRVYVERIDVNGNTLTQDKVIRREFRLAEGDAFNSLQVKRSTSRINSLGYFQEKFEIEQKPGSAPDRIVLEANVEEKPTGELQLSAGYSSLEKLIFQGSVQQRNFRGRGQTIGLSLSYSNYSKSAEVSFTEPYLFDRNVSLGFNVYRRDYNSFNYLNNDRNTTYKQATTGFQLRAGIPLTEYISAVGSYTFNIDDVTLDPTQFFSDRVTPGVRECDPLLAGRYLCEAIGKRTSSILGLSLIYDSLDSRIRPSRGRSASVTAEFAGLGGSVKYGRLRGNVAQYWPIGKGWIFSLRGEGGLIKSFETRGAGIEPVRLTDRFYLGEPEMRGFDIRGVGPRVLRKFFIDTNGDGVADNFSPDRDNWGDDALGGKYYYLGHAELEIPLGSGARELGLRPSVFVDVGAVWGLRRPNVEPLNFPYSIVCNGAVTTGSASSQAAIPTLPATCTGSTDGVIASTPFQEFFVGNTKKPRVSVGIGVNWNSPFGPFRIDFAKVLVKSSADDTKSFTFNVGTQF